MGVHDQPRGQRHWVWREIQPDGSVFWPLGVHRLDVREIPRHPVTHNHLLVGQIHIALQQEP